jgi:Mannosyltransferase (PIG-V)
VSSRLRDGFRLALPVFAVALLATTALSLIAVGLIRPFEPIAVTGWPSTPAAGGWRHLFAVTERQDALWFLRIAVDGYRLDDGSAAFFPLYPAAIRAVSFVLGGHPLAAALLVSWASFLGALTVLAALTLEEFGGDDALARRTLIIAAVFPTAFFLLSPYSEAPFLLLSIACLRAARRDQWAAAAACGALAALTRGVGVLLIPALAFEAWRRSGADGRPLVPRLTGAAAVAAGPLLYLAYWEVEFGDGSAPFDAEQRWGRTAALFPWSLVRAAQSAWTYRSYWLLDAVIVAVVLVTLIVAIRRLPTAYSVYAWLSLLLPLSYPFPDRPLLSVPRFAAVLFPVAWVLAGAPGRRPVLFWPLAAVSAGGAAWLFVLFVNWRYIF